MWKIRTNFFFKGGKQIFTQKKLKTQKFHNWVWVVSIETTYMRCSFHHHILIYMCVLQHYTYQGKFLRTKTATSSSSSRRRMRTLITHSWTLTAPLQKQPKDPNCTLNLDSLFPPSVGLMTQLMIQVGNILTHTVSSLVILLAKKKKI